MKISVCGISPNAIALAAVLGLSLSGLHRSDAAPRPLVADDGPTVTLLSPAPHATFSGVKPVEISAFYQSTAGNGIVSLDLYIDGVKAQSKALDAPESKGIVSFLVDASLLTPGPHRFVVNATAADAEVRSTKGAFEFATDGGLAPGLPAAPGNELALPGAAPKLRLLTPSPNSKVQGTVVIQVGATDADGKTPYVSIFVDGDFKTLVNYRPFEYEWDTTALSNGWHTIAVTEAFDTDGQAIAHLKPIRVFVNNPGGLTSIRPDLLDGTPKAVKSITAKSVKSPALKAIPARKTTATRPLARRPSGEALLAVPTLTARAPRTWSLEMAHGGLRWDGLPLEINQELSDPFVPDLPASHTSRIAAHSATPLSGFKRRTANPLAAPVIAAALPTDNPVPPMPVRGTRLQRIAKAGPLASSDLSSPFLSLPSLPAVGPHKIAVAAAHPAVQSHLMWLALHMPHLQVHLPQFHLQAPKTVKPHFALGAASLLGSIGQQSVLFNSAKVRLDRPLAAQQNVLFGPLRQIFEYGGGSLAWNSRTGVVRAQSPTRDIRLTIGDKRAMVNAQPFTLAGAPYLSAGRTMIPLSFLSKAMDVNVQFDPATNHLRITSKH